MTSDKRPLLAYLRVQEDTDRQILSILRSGAAAIERALRQLEASSNISAVVKRSQLTAALKEIRKQQAVVWERIGLQVQAGRAAAAAAAVEVTTGYASMLLRTVLAVDQQAALVTSLQATAERGVQNAINRVTLSRVSLSQRVYRTEQLANGQIDRIVSNVLSHGGSAREIARDVRAFIKPNTPGGVRYAAQRLGRTELNNAFHATQVVLAQDSPFIIGMKWNLSGSHPRPDECNDYAERNGGVFKPADVPRKPHPQCLCYLTPQVIDRAEFRAGVIAGRYDAYFRAVM